MARKPTIVRQIELTRALRAAKAAGFEVGRVDIDVATGRISILGQAAPPEAASTNSAAALDEWMAKRARAS